MRSFTLLLFGTVAAATTTAISCDDVYTQCIQGYTNNGQSPFFPECNARKAACLAGSAVPTTPVPTFPGPSPSATPTGAKCDDVYNRCIQEYTNNGQSPFFPECNSRKAACLAGSVVPTTPVPTFPGPSPSATPTSTKCDDVYNRCIQEYTNNGQSPFFPECNSRKAACLAGSIVPTTPVPTLPGPTTPTAHPPVFTGVAAANDARSMLGLIALVVAAAV